MQTDLVHRSLNKDDEIAWQLCLKSVSICLKSASNLSQTIIKDTYTLWSSHVSASPFGLCMVLCSPLKLVTILVKLHVRCSSYI